MINDEKILISFGKNLQQLRRSRNVTQEGLAEMADFDRTYISLLERGKRNPSLITLCKIAVSLKIELTELLENLKLAKDK